LPHHVEPGSIFSSRYVIHGLIGEGGMASVYRALDQVEGKPVAVKVLKRELAQAVGADRFAREVDIASAMEHPNVVSLTDAGTSGEWLYCVMPLFEGETLRDRIDREGQLPINDALTIADAVAQGLDYAHDRGIVHRDVKPENILLSGDNVGLADFGIARAVVQAEQGNKLTSTGIVIGTPTYMSPEQAAADKVDGRSDIYALGCVLYEMLSGGEPFTAPTAQGLLARHVRDPVPDLRTVRPELPDPIWSAIEKAMAKAPGDRFQTAGEFLSASRRPEAEPGDAERGSGRWWPWRRDKP